MYTRTVMIQMRPTRTSFGRYSRTAFLRLRSHSRAVSVPCRSEAQQSRNRGDFVRKVEHLFRVDLEATCVRKQYLKHFGSPLGTSAGKCIKRHVNIFDEFAHPEPHQTYLTCIFPAARSPNSSSQKNSISAKNVATNTTYRLDSSGR